MQSHLELIKHKIDDLEYWSARELMDVLGYKSWAKFKDVISKAMIACQTSGQEVSPHFARSGKMVNIGFGSQRNLDDLLLTRYACYLIAQNGDSSKIEVAYAQTYFAFQTRKQELNEERLKEDKRLEARNKLKETESKIQRTIYDRGIKLPVEFAIFKDKHIKALYGGISTKSLKKRRNIPNKRALADFDSHVELRAKDFALAMTDHNIKDKDITGKPKLQEEVVNNSKATRQALLKRGIKPELLNAQEDIKKIENRRSKENKQISNV